MPQDANCQPFLPFRLLLALIFLCPALYTQAQLQADFTMDHGGGCSPLIVSFTNRTTAASASATYSWDLGNGNSSTTKNPQASYTNPQLYTVTLTVNDGSQTSTSTQQVSVYQNPVVNFSPGSPIVCMPSPVNFISTSTAEGGIASYYWDFGDGSTQQTNSASQAHTYASPQTPTVSLTVTDNHGCHTTVTKTNAVAVLTTLTTSFTANQTIICQPTDPVQFSNISSGPGTLSYLWDFGDGTTSALPDPSHAFGAKGIYTIKLTTTSSQGCTVTSTQNNYLDVDDFTSNFNLPNLVCGNTEVSLINTGSPIPDNSTWQLDGSFLGSSSSVGFASPPGLHTVTLINNFGACSQTASKSFTVQPSPILLGFVDSIENLCGVPATVQLRDTTAGDVKWAWDIDRFSGFNPTLFTQNPSVTYTTTYNVYTVELQATNSAGCTSTATKEISIQAPYANIFYSNSSSALGLSGCQGLTATFSASGNIRIVTYHWDFGNGQTSSLASPTVTYTDPGNYQVVLTFTDINGCTTTATTSVTVNPRPNFDVTVSPGDTICGNTQLTFNIGAASLYDFWNFGDGSSYYVYQNSDNFVTHQYPRDGVYTATVIFSIEGCVDTVSKTITVLPSFPHISSNVNTCDGTRGLVVFQDTSYKANSWNWDFGDNSPDISYTTAQPQVSHTYTRTGAYKVTLTTTNGQCTNSDFATAYVLVKQKPLLTAAVTKACTNGPLDLTVSNMDANPLPYGFYFNGNYTLDQVQYGDSTPFTGQTIQNDEWITGTDILLYNLDVTKKDFRVISTSEYFNCQDTSNFLPIAIAGSQAAFQVQPSQVCLQSPVTLKDISATSPGDPIKTWLWNFGDGTSSTQSGPLTHSYPAPGSYPVSLTITDASGCQSSITYPQYVVATGPLASFSASGNIVPLNTTVFFYNTTNTFAGSGNFSWQWTFGDGGTSTDYLPAHTYMQTGTYTVTLTATDLNTGCSSQATATVTVNNFNSAFSLSFSYITVNNCPPARVQFNNTSQNYTSVSWDFGDGIMAGNVNSPSHIYQNPGKYIVTLSVFGPNGLTGQYLDSVIVQQPTASLTVATPQLCLGQPEQLDATPSPRASYTWDFGDGGNIPSTAVDSSSHTYQTAGVYTPTLIVTDSSGCTTATDLPASITVRPDPAITFSPAQPYACLGGSVNLQAQLASTPGSGSFTYAYAWSPSTGLSQDNIASPIASPSTTSTYQLQVTDDIGCQNSAGITVTVVQPEKVAAEPDTSICSGTALQLNAKGADRYAWIFNTTGLSDTLTDSPIARPPAADATDTITYTVTGSDAYACFSDTARVTVAILPLPTVNAGPDLEVLAGNPIQIPATGSNDVVSWNWTPSDYLSCTNCAQPISTPGKQIQYKITVTALDGCTASDTILVKILCEESRVAIPNAFTPNGDGNNDRFVIKGISLVKHLVIFDRWGARVFERNNFVASDRSSGWDGTFNGYPSPAGIYVYFAEMECPAGGAFSRQGTVILIR